MLSTKPLPSALVTLSEGNLVDLALGYLKRKEKIAILCRRFQYRGILKAVHEDYLVLDPGMCVEISGMPNEDKPVAEVHIPEGIVLPTMGVEIIHQCKWSQAPLPGEPNWRPSESYL